MTFVPNPNDPPEQRIVDKLVAAGWVESAVRIAEPKPSDPHASRGNIKWTDKGVRRAMSLVGLIHAIEEHSTPVCNDELLWLRVYAQGAVAASGDGFGGRSRG